MKLRAVGLGGAAVALTTVLIAHFVSHIDWGGVSITKYGLAGRPFFVWGYGHFASKAAFYHFVVVLNLIAKRRVGGPVMSVCCLLSIAVVSAFWVSFGTGFVAISWSRF